MSKLRVAPVFAQLTLVAAVALQSGTMCFASGADDPAQHKLTGVSKSSRPISRAVFAGFDKDAYPGDDLIRALSKSFAFTGYWLNNPPGMMSNPWMGKRSLLRARGLGFTLLFNGRLYADLKAAAAQGEDSAELGRSDAEAAIVAARREGFPSGAVIFLDQEEGGHLLPEQSAYLFAWIDALQRWAPSVRSVSKSKSAQPIYRAGVYCSGIAASASDPATTAADILQHYGGQRAPVMWVANDQCPPAPGCVRETKLPLPSTSGTPVATVWQYAQSPRRAQLTAGCAATYSTDNGCYAPGLPHSPDTAIDLDSATSPDPSHGR
ncbi:MAG TPA: glycoside hydrolase domain-containing protein [Acidisarcina sp.]